MEIKNGINSIKTEIQNFKISHINNNKDNKKFLSIVDDNPNGKVVLNNLIRKNKKYQDLYELITLKTNNNNKEKILRGKRYLSEEKKSKNNSVTQLIKPKLSHIQQIKNLYNEIESFNNNHIRNLKSANSRMRNKSSSKQNIFDSLNIKTHFEKPLKTNRSNINMLENEKKNNFINLKKVNQMSQKNLLKNTIPKPKKRKFNDNDVKNWINQEKYGNGYKDNFYNEKKLNISDLMAFTRNADFVGSKNKLITQKNNSYRNSREYSNDNNVNFFEILK